MATDGRDKWTRLTSWKHVHQLREITENENINSEAYNPCGFLMIACAFLDSTAATAGEGMRYAA